MSGRSIAMLMIAGAMCGVPARADAQWYIGAYFGGNHSRPSDVTIDQPARQTSLRVHDVHFDAKPLASPQYYGWRAGRLFGAARRFGVELEFIHLKIISRTADAYLITGQADGAVVDGVQRMDTFVQRYAMTHGLNFVLINAVARVPLGASRFAAVARTGAGPTVPHAESAVGGQPREQYEYAGMGGHLAAGLDTRLTGRWSLIAEYKLTTAEPTISIVDGTGRTSALTHQVAVGLAFGLAR